VDPSHTTLAQWVWGEIHSRRPECDGTLMNYHKPRPSAILKVLYCPLFILFFLLILLPIIAGCLFLDNGPYDFNSGSQYEMVIETSEPITNATFYLPLPVKNSIPTMGAATLSENDFIVKNYSVAFTRSPPGLNLAGSYPVPDDEPMFLRIHADSMEVDPGYFYPNASFEVRIGKPVWHNNPGLFLNTLSPVGNESVIFPKFNFSPPAPVRETGPYMDFIGYRYVRTPQRVPIYADYSASPSAIVSVFLSIHEYNGWRQETRSLGNSYTDSAYWVQKGEAHGWQRASGDYTPGVGVYPVLSSPTWQEVMKRYQEGK